MINFSILCVYNDSSKLDNYLKKSLNNQKNITLEKKYINNVNGKFNCAKKAFLSEIDNLKGEYIIFSHQDIIFNNQNELFNIYNTIKKIKNFGVIGIAGVIDKKIYSNITHGYEKKEVSIYKIDVPLECETLDECLFVIKNEKKYINLFKKIIVDGWHLYAVEYCMLLKMNKEKVYIINSDIYHASSGYSFDNSYYTQLKKIVKKYKKEYKIIRTTCGIWYTNQLLLFCQIMKRKAKIIIKQILSKE